MSKLLDEGLLSELLETRFIPRERETLLRILALLKNLKQNKSEKMAKISRKLSEILNDEKNSIHFLRTNHKSTKNHFLRIS